MVEAPRYIICSNIKSQNLTILRFKRPTLRLKRQISKLKNRITQIIKIDINFENSLLSFKS